MARGDQEDVDYEQQDIVAVPAKVVGVRPDIFNWRALQ